VIGRTDLWDVCVSARNESLVQPWGTPTDSSNTMYIMLDIYVTVFISTGFYPNLDL